MSERATDLPVVVMMFRHDASRAVGGCEIVGLCLVHTHASSHLMQCHAREININVEGHVEVVGEDIQRNMSDDLGDLSVREALIAKRLYATRSFGDAQNPIRFSA